MEHHSHLAQFLGIYIFETREEMNMSQIELADKLSFSSQFLGRIEKGAVMMPEESLVQTIEILSFDPKKLVKLFVRAAELDAKRLLDSSKNASGKKKKSSSSRG
jgi:transcriptional regulator with XRE-family HTH domain